MKKAKTWPATILFSVAIILIIAISISSNHLSYTAFAKNGFILPANKDEEELTAVSTSTAVAEFDSTDLTTDHKTVKQLVKTDPAEKSETATEITSVYVVEPVLEPELTTELVSNDSKTITEKTTQNISNKANESVAIAENATDETTEIAIEKKIESTTDKAIYTDENEEPDVFYVPNDAVCRFSFDYDSDYYVYCYEGTAQSITDRENCANYFWFRNTLVICDHNYQGFWRVRDIYPGQTCKLRYADGSVVTYECVDCNPNGYNDGHTIIDKYSGEELFYGEFVTYTCNDWDGYNVTVARWVEVV